MQSLKNFGFALVQMNVTDNKQENNTTAMRLIRTAVEKNSAKAVMLPGMFNTPFGKRQMFEQFAETIPNGETCMMMSKLAKELQIYLIIGSMPELDETKKNTFYNTMVVFGPNGTMLAKHRQMHVMNMNMTDFQMMNDMGDYMKTGKMMTTFDMEGMKIGMCVGMDMFYGEMGMYYRKMNVDLMLVATCLPEKMGEMYNEMLMRTHAVQDQMYVFGMSGTRTDKGDCSMYGHSMFVDLFGRVMKKADYGEEILFQMFDFTTMKTMRMQMPIYENKRNDLYQTTFKF